MVITELIIIIIIILRILSIQLDHDTSVVVTV